MHPIRIFSDSANTARRHAALTLGALALALFVGVLLMTDAAVGAEIGLPTMVGFSGEVSPATPPVSKPAPVTLRMGFTSGQEKNPVPELSQIAFEITWRVSFQTAGLPRCPISKLLSSYGNSRQTCAGSLVGHGSVVSEITLPGKAPTTSYGRLLAFYDEKGSIPYVLAQVTTGGEEPLTYVVPFQIERTAGIFGTRLIVEHMHRFVLGRGLSGGAYTFKGVYGHISKFELSLHRRFRHEGKSESFVRAECPAGGPHHIRIPDARIDYIPWMRLKLGYASGADVSLSAYGLACGRFSEFDGG